MRLVISAVIFALTLTLIPLWLPAPAVAQEGIDMTVDGWVFDVPETAGMGPEQPTGQPDWYAEIAEACAVYGCDPDYVYAVMLCESGGDPNAVAYNETSGNYTTGLMQIDDMWGGASMSPVEQIWFAAEHLTAGDIWWECG